MEVEDGVIEGSEPFEGWGLFSARRLRTISDVSVLGRLEKEKDV